MRPRWREATRNGGRLLIELLCALCVALGVAVLVVAQQPKAAAVFAITRSGGFFRSDDGGRTWQSVLTGEDIGGPATYSAMALNPADPAVLLVARTGRGGAKQFLRQDRRSLYHSLDGGQSWSRTDLPTLTGLQLQIDPNRKEVVYLGAEEGVFRSTDSGQTWTLTLSATARSGFASRGLALDPSQPGVVYATISGTGIVKSVDYGATWSAVASGIGSGYPVSAFLGAIAVDPKDSKTLYIPGQGSCASPAGVLPECGLFRSLDAGKSWERVAIPGMVSNVIFDARNGAIYAAGRIDEARVNNEPGRAMFHRSTDGGKTWTSVTVEPGAKTDLEVSLDPLAPSTLWARVTTLVTTSNETLSPLAYVSTDQGATWSKVQVSAPAVAASDALVALQSVNAAASPAAPAVTHVSAASFRSGALSPGSIASALGSGLTSETASAGAETTLSLGGVRIAIVDANGRSWSAPLFFVSPGQINYLVPSDVALGTASISIERAGAAALTRTVSIAELAPGVFALNSSGLAAATVLRASGGAQSSEPVYTVDAGGAVVARPIDLKAATDEVYLLIFGTGFRSAGASRTTVSIGGVAAEVLYSGPQGSFAGLDQINVRIPPALAGRGSVEVRVSAGGVAANATSVAIQ